MKNPEKYIILITLFTVLSAFITTSAIFYFFGESFRDFVLASILSVGLPLFTTPIVSYKYLQLLKNYDESNEKLKNLQANNDQTKLYTHDYTIKLAKKHFLMAQTYNLNYSITIFELKNILINDKKNKTFLRFASILKKHIKKDNILGHLYGSKLILFSSFVTKEMFTEYLSLINEDLKNNMSDEEIIKTTICSFTITKNVNCRLTEIVGYLLNISENCDKELVIQEYVK